MTRGSFFCWIQGWPVGVLSLDCVRKRFSGFYRFKRFKGVGAAHKKQKRREGLKLAVFSYRKPNP